MKIQITQTLTNGQTDQIVLSKADAQILKFQAQPSTKLSFTIESDKPANSTQAKKNAFRQVGNDLVLEADGEPVLEIVDYYATAGASIGEVSWSFASAEAPMAMTPIAETEVGGLTPLIAPAWIGAAVGGPALVASSGFLAVGIGAANAETLITVSGVIVLGPVISGNGLVVTLYKADGSVLATTNVEPDGTFHTSFASSYTGQVLAKVTDTTTTADYLDEATNTNKDLTVHLHLRQWHSSQRSSDQTAARQSDL